MRRRAHPEPAITLLLRTGLHGREVVGFSSSVPARRSSVELRMHRNKILLSITDEEDKGRTGAMITSCTGSHKLRGGTGGRDQKAAAWATPPPRHPHPANLIPLPPRRSAKTTQPSKSGRSCGRLFPTVVQQRRPEDYP